MNESRLDGPVGRDEAFELLADHRRRLVLGYVHQTDGPVSLDELTEAVASAEAEQPTGDGPDADAVACSLHHCHLPKLDAAGIVDYAGDGTVESTGATAGLVERLETVEGAAASVPEAE